MSIIEFDTILDETITIPKEAVSFKGCKVHVVLTTDADIPSSGNASLEEGYRAMAQDIEREKEAQEWIESIMPDNSHETR